ncbi:two pore potassium channel protein sup-9-like [Mya arenaria]|uniref:two pore potassium channel protein sup-9-like n=1 Tax=Mya arenaria TaxID=6604 RepID=UPI0022E7E898|nr:two pore potassium channel protein sup-9-like [Mya arenaria]XP_052764192.1 two pore potassium channel protein sup-9-like [Mya arenaria]
MKKQNTRTLSLIVCTFTYLLVGAAVFDALESETEREKSRDYSSQEHIIRSRYNMTDNDFNLLRRNIILSVPYKAGTQWKFAGAFYFALTVITTIGYGHSTPQTDGGKIFCMLYALIGIPLCIVMFQSVGERLNTFVTFLMKQGKKCIRMKKTEVSQTNLIIVTMSLSMIVLTSGSAAFVHYEGWDYIDSLYYCFITLTTIGFGDLVALQRDNALETKPYYVAFSIIFILFGLTVISAAMNLLVLRFLTMNTADERRDELEAAAAAQTAVRLDGDVITGNGVVVSQAMESPEYNDHISVCSCSCYKIRSKDKHRYKVTRSPTKINHLLQMNNITREKEDVYSFIDENNSSNYQYLNKKRASV